MCKDGVSLQIAAVEYAVVATSTLGQQGTHAHIYTHHTHRHVHTVFFLHPAILVWPAPGAGGRNMGVAVNLVKSHFQEWGRSNFLSKMASSKPKDYK